MNDRVLYSRAFDDEFLGTVIRVGDVAVEAVLCRNDRFGSGYLAALSPAAGCPVGCEFCDMSELPFYGNLTPGEIEDELGILLEAGAENGFDAYGQPLKIAFVKGGEALLNPDFPETYERLMRHHPGCEMKVSTTFPVSPDIGRTYREVVDQARTMAGMAYLQISLLSTSRQHRRDITRMELLPFEQIAEYGEAWFEATGIKPTLTMTITDRTPCDPDDIRHVLTPDTFAVRLRDWIPNEAGRHSGCRQPSDETVRMWAERFADAGYLMIPGKPDDIQISNGICSGHFLKEIHAVGV